MTASGPAGFSEDPRQRIVAAVAETVDLHGPLSLTVEGIVRVAGLSTPVFYEHFDDVDDCFDFVCDLGLHVFFDPFEEAYATPGLWAERLRAAISALLSALSKEPLQGEICLIHSLARQADGRTYRRAIDLLTEALREARPARVSSSRGEKLLAGGAIGLIAARLADGRGPELEDLAPQLRWLLVAPLEIEAADWCVPARLG